MPRPISQKEITGDHGSGRRRGPPRLIRSLASGSIVRTRWITRLSIRGLLVPAVVVAALAVLSIERTNNVQASYPLPGSADPISCPITQPPAQPFVPPSPYPAKPGPGTFLVRLGQAMDGFARRWNVARITTLHAREHELPTEAFLVATRL